MKKINQIAKYDFKRIAFNPITLIGYAIVLVVCLIVGFAYKIPKTPAYTVSLAGETTREIYNSFTTTDATADTKENLDLIFEEAKTLLSLHDSSCPEAEELILINDSYREFWTQLDTYKKWAGNPNQPQPPAISAVSNATSDLDEFVTNFKSIKPFRTRLVLTKAQMKDLEKIVTFFKNTLNDSTSQTEKLNTLYANKKYFELIDEISSKAFTFNVDTVHLTQFQADYIQVAQDKLDRIFNEMKDLRLEIEFSDVKNMDKMLSLATNYKLTCESARVAIEKEYTLLLDKLDIKINKIYGYEKFSLEETKRDLAFAKYFLQDDGLYYSKYQHALNFNTASYKTTAFDHAYFMMSIVGFLTILLGIFSAYKLFGRDRVNGKMDLILSQKVSFNEVFIGKFLAVLCITGFCILGFGIITFIWGAIFYGFLPGSIIAVFNTNTVYTISPFLFLLIKLIGIEMQAIFYSVLTIFMMNISRKFDIMFGVTVAIFAVATICNIFLNGQIWWCLLPFIHADITSFIGGGSMSTGFLKTSMYAYGNFFISLVYHLLLVVLLFTFTKRLFKKN